MKKSKPKNYCTNPRKRDAIKALLCLAWRTPKNSRPKWLREDLKAFRHNLQTP